MTYLKGTYELSERKACQVMSIHRSTYRHRGIRQAVDPVTTEVVRLSERYPYWGYRKIYNLVDRDRLPVGRERVRLIRRREGLQVRKNRKKRRVLGQSTQWVYRATHPNHVWSYDFVHDQTVDGRSLRFLTVVDEFTRDNVATECARSLTSQNVIRILEQLIDQRGAPQCLRSDNVLHLESISFCRRTSAVASWRRHSGLTRTDVGGFQRPGDCSRP